MEEVVRVDNLYKTFKLSSKQRKIEKTNDKLRKAVQGISFSVNKGEIYGLLGPNGAGKTTTLRMLATLIKPDSGEAKIFGNSILTESEKVRTKIGFLSSYLKLDGFFTPNYLFDYFSRLYKIDENESETRKIKLFKKFGIDKYAETEIKDLSTGMKQKISLVISLVNDPDVIIFDEPTNGLDIIAAKHVTDFLLQLKKDGKTIIVSTHIFDLIEKICDRVGIIINGKLVFCDYLSAIIKEKSLEDKFFEIYRDVVGEYDE